MADTPAPTPGGTAWSAVLSGAGRGSPEWRSRLGRLISAHWRPVFWHLQRLQNLSPEEASAQARQFFTALSRGDVLDEASPERGRFRTFLKARLRGLAPEGAGTEPEPDETFDRDWAAVLLQDSIGSLEASLAAEGREVVSRAFRECVFSNPARSYRECAEQLGIPEDDVRHHVHAARTELREIVRGRIRESLASERELEEEYAYLMELFER